MRGESNATNFTFSQYIGIEGLHSQNKSARTITLLRKVQWEAVLVKNLE